MFVALFFDSAALREDGITFKEIHKKKSSESNNKEIIMARKYMNTFNSFVRPKLVQKKIMKVKLSGKSLRKVLT